MPPGFDVMDNKVEVWLPLRLDPSNRRIAATTGCTSSAAWPTAGACPKRRPRSSTLYARWEDQFGAKTHKPSANFHQLQMEPAQAEIVGSASRAIWVLQAAVGFVLLIACANLANLLLARAETRHREFAVRAALGAGRAAAAPPVHDRGHVLSLVGGVLGLAVAVVGLRPLLAAYPESLPRSAEVSLDPTVLGFTLLVSLATGIIFGLAPLLHLSPTRSRSPLRKAAAAARPASARHWVRRGLVMAEVALAVMLVVGAGLMLRTVVNLMQVDAGFDRSRLTTFALDLPTATYADGPPSSASSTGSPRGCGRRRAWPASRRCRGCRRTAAWMPTTPTSRGMRAPKRTRSKMSTITSSPRSATSRRWASPSCEGRAFEPADLARGPAVAINEALAERFFRGRNRGRRPPQSESGAEYAWLTVIGIAKDVKQGGVDQKTGTELYFLAEQLATAGFPARNMNVVVRSALPAANPARRQSRRSCASPIPSLPMIRYRAMDEVFAESVSRPRLLAQLLAGLRAWRCC